ncbi:RHS repeat-associated core domain-containing protein [Streptomyces buecherae]|uniref:RHS repeat-associated core domain-containing protein n=1 Tax=Streptomyces buecherae TaxID=2763006 RepID=UPI0027E36AB1|nr:RHS repeat-associated core domain-containing protein [Streptomyces buecherae]
METKNGATTAGWSYCYDKAGNRTNQTYAGTNNTQRLKAGSTTFTNAAVGMTRQRASDTATGFVREPSGTLVAMRSGESSQYYLTDLQGSVTGLVEASGRRTATYSYGPYGEARTTNGTDQPYRYTSTYLDTSGLYEMGHRYYDPNSAASLNPTPAARNRTPTSTRQATPSTVSPHRGASVSAVWRTLSGRPATWPPEPSTCSKETQRHCVVMPQGAWWEAWLAVHVVRR